MNVVHLPQSALHFAQLLSAPCFICGLLSQAEKQVGIDFRIHVVVHVTTPNTIDHSSNVQQLLALRGTVNGKDGFCLYQEDAKPRESRGFGVIAEGAANSVGGDGQAAVRDALDVIENSIAAGTCIVDRTILHQESECALPVSLTTAQPRLLSHPHLLRVPGVRDLVEGTAPLEASAEPLCVLVLLKW